MKVSLLFIKSQEFSFKYLFSGGPHDRVCMNDCYLNFKYEYELVTSYDVDEIILPRLSLTSDLKEFKSFDCSLKLNEYKPTYNLYNYGINLLNQFGRNNIACLMFKHVAFLPNGPELELFIKEINQIIESNTIGKATYFGKKKESSVTHEISEQTFIQAQNVIKYHNLSSCLKNRYIKNELIGEEFQRFLGVYFDSRWGKSIIHTNLTETLNHHSCDTFTHGIKFDTPLKFGFVSHFRTEIDGFLQADRVYPFSNVLSDIEYYLFLCYALGK